MIKYVYILVIAILGYFTFSYTVLSKENEKLHTKITQLKAIIRAKDKEVELCDIYNSILSNTGVSDAKTEVNDTITFDPNKL